TAYGLILLITSVKNGAITSSIKFIHLIRPSIPKFARAINIRPRLINIMMIGVKNGWCSLFNCGCFLYSFAEGFCRRNVN
ncbi:hypothetical protein, partial [Yersinia ruckeri]